MNECPDTDYEGDHYPGGYMESFFIPTINGVSGSGEQCELSASVPNGEEIRIGASSFNLCSNRPVTIEPECPEPDEDMLRTHKDNPITITLNTSAGAITVYCYNFPA